MKKKNVFLWHKILFTKMKTIMDDVQTLTPQYPDFGALLESVRENGRRMDANYERYLKEQAEREARWESEKAERDARLDKMMAESNARIEASNARMDKISRKTDKAIREMKNVFTTQWGRLVEALCKPAAFKLFKKEGIMIDRIYEGVHKATVDGQDVMEIDVALCDTSVAVIVEVKTRCGKQDIDYFLGQMEHCKEWYEEFADKELRVAMAAVSYDSGAIKYALRKGLYVLKLTGEETFKMTPPSVPLVF